MQQVLWSCHQPTREFSRIVCVRQRTTRDEHERPRHVHPVAALLGAAMYVGTRVLLEQMVVPMTTNLVML